MNKWKKSRRGSIYNRINKVMEKFYSQPESIDEAVKLLVPIYFDLKTAYYTTVNKLNDLYKKDGEGKEYDTSNDGNGYRLDDDEYILGTLFYVSDRWNSPSRIKFLINVIEKYHPEICD